MVKASEYTFDAMAMFYNIYCIGQGKAGLGSVGLEAYSIWRTVLKEKNYISICIYLLYKSIYRSI